MRSATYEAAGREGTQIEHTRGMESLVAREEKRTREEEEKIELPHLRGLPAPLVVDLSTRSGGNHPFYTKDHRPKPNKPRKTFPTLAVSNNRTCTP